MGRRIVAGCGRCGSFRIRGAEGTISATAVPRKGKVPLAGMRMQSGIKMGGWSYSQPWQEIHKGSPGVWAAFVRSKRCLIVNPKGKIVVNNHGENDQIVVGQIEISGQRGKFLTERRPGIYGEIRRHRTRSAKCPIRCAGALAGPTARAVN